MGKDVKMQRRSHSVKTPYIIESGSILLAEKEGEHKDQTIYRYDFISNGGDITMTGNIGAATFSISGGTLELNSGGDGNTNLTAYGSGWKQGDKDGSQSAANYDRDKANGLLSNMEEIIVNKDTNVSALNLLTIEKSKVTLSGSGDKLTVNDAGGDVLSSYLQGSKQIKISHTDITVNGSSNAIVSANGQINDSTIKVNSKAKLLITGAHSHGLAQYSLSKTDIINQGELILGETSDSGSDSFTITGGTIKNTGTVDFKGGTLNLDSALVAGLFASGDSGSKGKLNLVNGAKVTVTGDKPADLSAVGIADASGNGFHLVASGESTWTQDKVKLGTKFNSKNLAFDVKSLTAETAPYIGYADTDNAFVIEQGKITVSNSITLVSGDGYKSGKDDRIYVVADDKETLATLNLVNDGSLTGKLNNVDRLYVGYAAKSHTASGTSTLNVDGNWNFGGTRLVANTNGEVNLNGTVDNIGILQIDKKGVVNISSNADVTVGRLLGGQDAIEGNKISIDGTLTFKGDGNKDDKNASGTAVNDIKLTTAKIAINNGGTLAITDDAVDNVVNASGAVITDNWTSGNVTLNAGGTLSLDLGKITLTQAQLGSLKSGLVNTGYKGSFDFGDGLNIQLEDEDVQKAIDNGEVSYSQLSDAGVNDVKGVADNAIVTVDSATASGATGINLSTGKAVELEGTSTVNVNSLVLTNTTGGNFVYTTNASGNKAANVQVTDKGAVNLTGNGTVGSLTKDASATGTNAVLTAGQGAIQKVDGEINLDTVTIGAGTVDVTESVTADELTVNGTLTVSGGEGAVSIGTTGATIAGTLNAGAVTSSGDMTVTGSVLANSIVLDTNKNLKVGDSSSSGLVEVETLDLNGGMLLIDPDWNQDASFVSITGGVKNPDVINVGGSIGVGRNSVGVIGAGNQEAQDALSRLGLLQASKLDEHDIGSALYLGNTLQVDNQKHVLVDKTMQNSDLSTAIGNMTTSSGSVTLNDGSALVLSESFSNELVNDPSKAIFNFAAADTGTTVTVTAESGAQIIFDSADILGGDSVDVANTSGAKIDISGLSNAEITAAGGLLVGNLGTAATNDADKIKFTLAQNASTRLYNQSHPIHDMTLDVIGNKNGAYDSSDEGVYYIGAMNAHDGGADIERTARMALYGGTVQATLMAQQTSTDAISERLGMANPNSALITSNNAQGGGLWLSPVYKNHDSDEFEAEGVNYGADIDLYGLALGADFTTESGVRVGAMFNVGSGDAEGQGIGEGVSNDFDYYGFSLYAGVTFGNFALTADAGFTQVSNDLEQAVNYHGVGTLKADTDTQTVSVGVRGEYLFATPWVDVVPHVGVRYTSFDMDSYQAQVDGYTIANADADSMQVFSIPFGVTFSKDMAMGNWVVKPVFDLNLTANAGDDELESDVAFVGVSNVALTTEVMDSFTYGATLGVSARYQESFSFGLNVGYTGSSSADEFGVNANARYTF